ncbi:MAG TPA: hypothetical protein VKP59_00635 [Candidatus Thermoplasmatota archaeon]|nr:hypothetical protein [Candidatus Thermoplasmatota archaeon]
MKPKIIALCIMMLLSIPILPVSATDDQSPNIPVIEGPCESKCGEMCEYSIKSTDPQGDNIFYSVRCSDDVAYIELGPYESGEIINFSHCWWTFYQHTNPFVLRVKAKDTYGHESEWGTFETNLTDLKIRNNIISSSNYLFFQLITHLINHFSIRLNPIFFT